MQSIHNFLRCFFNKANYLQPIILLLMRLWIARVFFLAGLVKIADFDNTVALFRDEYMTPFISPTLAAFSATSFELACPIFIALGLASRLAVLPLLVMTLVIQLTYDQNIQHAYWGMLLLNILAFGSGKFSLDYLLGKKILK